MRGLEPRSGDEEMEVRTLSIRQWGHSLKVWGMREVYVKPSGNRAGGVERTATRPTVLEAAHISDTDATFGS